MEKTEKCPDCRSNLKPIIYGMVPEGFTEENQVILGGCLLDGREPHVGCENCGYRGAPGGRMYKTAHTKPKYKLGTENSENPEIIQVVFDVVEASDDELWGWAEGLFEARLELLHRGVPREAIEEYGENAEFWDAMPFEPTELGIIQYDPVAQKIVGAEIFFAHGKMQVHTYRLPEMKRWGSCFTVGDFFFVQENFRPTEALETWQFLLAQGQSDDAFGAEDTDLGHPLIKAMLASGEVPKHEMEKYAQQFERFFIWPAWCFEPTIAFGLGKRSHAY